MTAPVETATRSETIAMTVPVETQSQAAGRYAMRFFLPAGYDLQTAPQPTDPRVHILELPERTLASPVHGLEGCAESGAPFDRP